MRTRHLIAVLLLLFAACSGGDTTREVATWEDAIAYCEQTDSGLQARFDLSGPPIALGECESMAADKEANGCTPEAFKLIIDAHVGVVEVMAAGSPAEDTVAAFSKVWDIEDACGETRR